MFGFPKHLVLTCALCSTALPMFAAEETTSVAPLVLPTATVKCPGVTSIPMTADAEQALPMQIIGSLACGSSVVVLSDNEGYTARIRTGEGVEGYVARMYLGAGGSAAPMMPKAKPSLATPTNGIVRWEDGAPGCDSFVSQGRKVESITANGITVQVSVQDTGWKFRVNVAVSNQGGAATDVQPGIVSLDELIPHLRTLPASSPAKLAHAATHQVLWTAATAEPPPTVGRPQLARRAQADAPVYRTTTTPDYLDPHMTLAVDRPGTFGRNVSVDLEAIALKPVTLSSGQKTAGVMWFERDSSAHEVSLRVPVGDMVFDYTFAFDQKK
jgi:hypothetical protein